MAMIVSRNATKDFTPNPLASPAYVDGKEWNWNRQFGHFGLGGLGGLGVMNEADAIAAIAAGAKPGSEAYEAYYGKAGFYSQEGSVKAAAAEASYYDEGLPAGPPAPMLYPAKQCGAAEMMTTDCVSHNAAVQQANMAIEENARRAWNLQVCRHNAAINPGTNDVPCTQYEARVPEPAVPGNPTKQQAVCSGGQCYTPFVGGTPPTASSGPAREVAPPTPQQQASYIANRPNQSVPPREQAGEVVVKTAAQLAAEKAAAEEAEAAKKAAGGGDGDGKIFGLDPVMLAVIAGVGALLLLKK